MQSSTQSSSSSRPQMSVTQALVDLKTLDSRIEKKRAQGLFITWKCNDEDAAKQKVNPGDYQSIADLIEYRKRLKGALVRSNARISVCIGKQEYTVAEAIERKASVKYDKELLNTMKTQLGNVTRQVETHNANVKRQLDSHLEKMFGSSKNTNPDDIKRFSDEYLRSHRAELIDPLGLAERIQRLEDEISEFENGVDVALSQVNATTLITV